MHAVGQPPFFLGDDGVGDDMFHYLTEANIPYSRLHDTYGVFAGNLFVDIPNIFRDFDADEKEIETNLGRGYTAYQIDEKHFMTKKRVSVKNFKLKQYDTLYLEKRIQ